MNNGGTSFAASLGKAGNIREHAPSSAGSPMLRICPR